MTVLDLQIDPTVRGWSPELPTVYQELADRAGQLAASLAGEDHLWDAEGRFPWPEVAVLGSHGVLGLTHPEEAGGAGLPRLAAVVVLEALAQHSFTLAEATQIAANGPAYVLSTIAAPRLRDRWVPRVLAGETLISIAITEVDAGSSLAEIATNATSDPVGWSVSGTKCFVTGGSLAGAHLVMARMGESPGVRGLGYVLVDAGAPGCDVRQVHRKIGGNATPEAVIDFAVAGIDDEAIVIHPDSGGFALAMQSYNAMRIGIAGMCCGVARRALDLAEAHLAQRVQGGRPLARRQGLQWRIAELELELESARLLTYRAASRVDEHGFPDGLDTARAKLAASRVAVAAADAAIQMLGWRGIVSAEDHPAERILREVRGWTIAGGTSESLLNMLGRAALSGHGSGR
ncbi:Acyl-CoA dehydrogenase, short-chain specific [Euzebya pacifica]|uniref:Acyl-CoA dehydrogenase, short-chain specific n=1 Tax=Euzebya pacifica TaxID=1608957 RepID=A0A346XWY0_9ACTN|nr:acyl-CoA dehydrogenase family protein [Euzebya pacifica]AXV06727.1 Acyl-CoA dehydrogenase, short-chain specific [Euzebya pacifica]